MNQDTPQDEQLVRLFRQGDRQSFEILMTRYQKPLFYMIKAIVIDREDARDITQEAFIRAFNRIHTLRCGARFKPWLFRIGANMARDLLKRRQQTVLFEENRNAGRQPDPAEALTMQDTLVHTKALLMSLPTRQREVVSLRLFNDMMFAEIGELLDMKEQTARSHFHFGITALRKLLKKRMVDRHEL